MTTMGCKRTTPRQGLRKVSKSPRRRQELRADETWARAIIDRAGNRCEKCGRIGTQAAHIVGKRNKVLRHHHLNGVALCPLCHDWADNQDPAAFREWLYLNRHERWCLIAGRFEGKEPPQSPAQPPDRPV